MKGILEFDLNDLDDVMAHKRAVLALDMALALYDIDSYLRGQLKHGELSDEAWGALDKVRERFYDVLRERSLSLDDLVN